MILTAEEQLAAGALAVSGNHPAARACIKGLLEKITEAEKMSSDDLAIAEHVLGVPGRPNRAVFMTARRLLREVARLQCLEDDYAIQEKVVAELRQEVACPDCGRAAMDEVEEGEDDCDHVVCARRQPLATAYTEVVDENARLKLRVTELEQ